MNRYYVYSYYDINGRPIYVGKTQDVFSRHKSHRKDAWMKYAKTIGVRTYPSKRDMNVAEMYYISERRPTYNDVFKAKDLFTGTEYKVLIEDTSDEIIYTLREFVKAYDPKTSAYRKRLRRENT